jgi:hypothetical protein
MSFKGCKAIKYNELIALTIELENIFAHLYGAMQFDYYPWLRYLEPAGAEAMHMEIRLDRVQNLERILRELLEIHALAPASQGRQLHMWLDLAISEARSQLEKMRLETVH